MPDFTEIPPERRPPRGTEETDFPVPAQPPPREKGMSGRERLMTIITAAIVAAFVTIVLVFGFQVVQQLPVRIGTHMQQGTVSVPANESIDVYYQVPFLSPPNVRFIVGFSDLVLLEQTADHFKIKNKSANAITTNWQAEGRPLK